MKTMFTSTSLQNVHSHMKSVSLSVMSEKQCGSGFVMDAEQSEMKPQVLCFKRGQS